VTTGILLGILLYNSGHRIHKQRDGAATYSTHKVMYGS